MTSLFDGLPAVEPSSLTGFSGNRIDRRSEARGPESLATALADPAARFYLFRGDPALVKTGDDPLFTAAEATALGADLGRAVLLGWAPDGPRLAAALADEAPIDETRVAAATLRALAISELLAASHLGALAQARALLPGTSVTASARSAVRRPPAPTAASGAIARTAGHSIFRVPTRW